MSIGLKEIANLANTSVSTVSRALSNDPAVYNKVKAVLRRQILKIANQHGYQPPTRQSTFNSAVLAFITPENSDIFWDLVFNGAQQTASRLGITLVQAYSNNNVAEEISCLENLKRSGIPGAIVAGSFIDESDVLNLEEKGITIVGINRQHPNQNIRDSLHFIGVNDDKASQIAVEYLIEVGHRRIGFIGLDEIRPRSSSRRLDGYFRAFGRANLKIREELIIKDEHPVRTMRDAKNVGVKYAPILHKKGATAIVAYNDLVGIGAVIGLQQNGFKVPKDCSVMGFDGIEEGLELSPQLSTMQQPRLELGQMAMLRLAELLGCPNHKVAEIGSELYMNILCNPKIDFDRIKRCFLPRLTPRESVGAPQRSPALTS